MDALLKAFVKRGMRVEVTEVQADANPYFYYRRDPDANVTRVMVDEEWVVFGLKERLGMVPPVALEPPKGLRGEDRVQWIRSHWPTRAFEPSGLLALTIKNAGSLDVRTEWKDGTRMRLEACLNDIVAHLHLVASV